MSSSFFISRAKRHPEYDISNFGNRNHLLGGEEDHYIENLAFVECHPDFEAVPIDPKRGPYGYGICRRRPETVKKPSPVPPKIVTVGKRKVPYKATGLDPGPIAVPVGVCSSTITHPSPVPEGFSDHGKTERIPKSLDYGVVNRYVLRDPFVQGIGGWNNEDQVEPARVRRCGAAHFPHAPPPKYDVNSLSQQYPVWKKRQVSLGFMTQEQADMFDAGYKVTKGSHGYVEGPMRS